VSNSTTRNNSKVSASYTSMVGPAPYTQPFPRRDPGPRDRRAAAREVGGRELIQQTQGFLVERVEVLQSVLATWRQQFCMAGIRAPPSQRILHEQVALRARDVAHDVARAEHPRTWPELDHTGRNDSRQSPRPRAYALEVRNEARYRGDLHPAS
jgi:hypothetical protein